MGILKHFSSHFVDYHKHVSEYGIHWNFFLTMAVIQLICGSLTSTLNRKFIILLAFTISIGHEFWLLQGNYQWIFDLTIKQRLQSGFVIANIEGLASITGYAGIYFSGAALKTSIYKLLDIQSWKHLGNSLNYLLITCNKDLNFSFKYVDCMEHLHSIDQRGLFNLALKTLM